MPLQNPPPRPAPPRPAAHALQRAADTADGQAAARRAAAAVADALGRDGSATLLQLDETGQLLHASNLEAVAEALGRSVDGLREGGVTLIRELDRGRLLSSYRRLVATPGADETLLFWAVRADQTVVQLRAVASNRLNEDLRAILIRIEVHEAIGEENTADEPSFTDEQVETALVDRKRFMHLVQLVIDAKERKYWSLPAYMRSMIRDRRRNYSLVLVNLDRGNVMAGCYGSAIAARAAQQAAERIGEMLRGRDAITNLGNSELAILLDGCGDEEHASRVANQLVDVLERSVVIDGQDISITPSLGIATSERRYDCAEELMQDAASAASHAMRSGHGKRRRVTAFSTELRVADMGRLAMITALRAAVKADQFFLHYQPIVRLGEDVLVGFEALVRWQHPTRGLVMPGDFIAIAEESGIIRDIGDRVLVEACTAMRRWNTTVAAAAPLVISVNVSASQFSEGDIARTVQRVLRNTGLEPRQLVIELTESTLLEDLDSAKEKLGSLVELGVGLALDDFGTGYSSLSCLHQLPFTELKIDRSFVKELDATRTSLLRSIIGLAQNLGLAVVVEGIETAPQRAVLHGLGCDFAQGYYFARPMPASDVDALLVKGPTWG